MKKLHTKPATGAMHKCVAYGNSHYSCKQIYMKAHVVIVFLFYIVQFTTTMEGCMVPHFHYLVVKLANQCLRFEMFFAIEYMCMPNCKTCKAAAMEELAAFLHTPRLAKRGLCWPPPTPYMQYKNYSSLYISVTCQFHTPLFLIIPPPPPPSPGQPTPGPVGRPQ